MLATVIVNRYGSADAKALADAVEELCSPNDAYGWSSSGVYCFWDIETREVLYVGLAIDLPLRFQQHNSLSSCAEYCCKRVQIAEYFLSHNQLGYSVLVQSTMLQAISHRWTGANPGELEWIAENFGFFDPDEVKNDLNHGIVESLRETESALLAAYRKDNGRLPIWNEIGGAKLVFPESKLDTARYLLRSFTRSHSRDDPLTARCTLREMTGAENSLKERFEMYLHAARMHALLWKTSLNEAFKVVPDTFGDLPKMRTAHYLSKQPDW